MNDLQILLDFLPRPTPQAWLKYAIQHTPMLLIDHAHCERKAASTALMFLSKYPEKADIVATMSPLAREELLHFEKVITLLRERGILYTHLKPSNYAKALHQAANKNCAKSLLCDQLIIGAIIEARSCERFNALVPLLSDKSLAKFYASLVKAEARHFQDYLNLARKYGDNVELRIEYFLELEDKLIYEEDTVFRFHSGIPSD